MLRRGKGAEASDRALLDKISAKEREVIDMRNRMEQIEANYDMLNSAFEKTKSN